MAAGKNEGQDFFEGAGLRLGLRVAGIVCRGEVLKYPFQENPILHPVDEIEHSRQFGGEDSEPRHAGVQLEMDGEAWRRRARPSPPLFTF